MLYKACIGGTKKSELHTKFGFFLTFRNRHRFSAGTKLQNRKNLRQQIADRRSGGDGEIRTLEALLTPTRFPVVRPRPARRHLLTNRFKKLLIFDCLIIIPGLRKKSKSFFHFLSNIFSSKTFNTGDYISVNCSVSNPATKAGLDTLLSCSYLVDSMHLSTNLRLSTESAKLAISTGFPFVRQERRYLSSL